MILEHVCFELVALCYGLVSCGAINETLCAYLVFNLCEGGGITNVYLEFIHVVRDLVRLKLYVRPGIYQEEVYAYMSICLYVYMYICIYACRKLLQFVNVMTLFLVCVCVCVCHCVCVLRHMLADLNVGRALNTISKCNGMA